MEIISGGKFMDKRIKLLSFILFESQKVPWFYFK